MNRNKQPFLEIAVASPLRHPLTYDLPTAGPAPGTGCRVLVPLGNRLVTGYVLGRSAAPPESVKLRRVSRVMGYEPLFPENLVPFFRWIADYYHYPIGEVIRGALPAGLTGRSGTKISISPEQKEICRRRYPAAEGPEWLAALYKKNQLSPAMVRKIRKNPADNKFLKQMLADQLLTSEELITGATTAERSEVCVILDKTRAAADPELKKKTEIKTLELLNKLSNGSSRPIPRPYIAGLYSGARTGLKSLEERGMITLVERPVHRDPFGEPPLHFPPPPELTEDQEEVLKTILPAINGGGFRPFLLNGVTGCGKTEVYLQASAAALSCGKSVLIMVPEIALASQIEGHFISRFGDEVALIHSGLSAGQRFDQWLKISRGEARIVIGARSAIFAPAPAPGLIIVDEEHDGAYKQEDGLRYQGRDLAVLRASQQGCPVILGSATPSIISFQNAMAGKYSLLNMPRRVADRALPPISVINLSKIPTISGRPPLFSKELVEALKENLAAGDQSLIFLNRRGYASMMLCRTCSSPINCPNCQVSLTLHQGRKELRCHYCGHKSPSSTICGNCKSTKMVKIGFGTERLEQELCRLFPKARIARLDRDTGHKRPEFIRILKAVHNQEIDILVGTQMITKGHHFPHVTLVGVIWADAGLGLPDFRAGERTFQLLSQVSGRAGRGEKPGRVMVQALAPDHYAITTAQHHDYQSMFKREKALRQALKYPPFGRLINLRFDGPDNGRVRKNAEKTAAIARKLSSRQRSITILGPAPAPLARIRGRYRWQLLIKGSVPRTLHSFCSTLIESCPASSANCKMTVDVDPENML